MLKLVYLVFIYCWYDGSLIDLWPFKIFAIFCHRHCAKLRELLNTASNSEDLDTPDQDSSVPFLPTSREQSYPAVSSVPDVENAAPVPRAGTKGSSGGVETASHLPLSGSASGNEGDERSASTVSEGRSAKDKRNDNDLKRIVIADKLTPLVVLTSFVSDLDLVADWVFFKEGLGAEGQLIYFVALAFAVIGTIMYVLVTVEFHLVSKAKTWWVGAPLSPLQHVPLGWQLVINVIVEDIPQLVITCVTSPTSVSGVLNIATAAFALLAKMAEAFATRRDLPMSSQLRMIEADPDVVRHVMEQRRNAEEQAANAAKLTVLVNKFKQEVDGSKRQAAIAFRVMQVDPGFLDGKLAYIRDKLLTPTMELDNCRLQESIPPCLGDLTQLTELNPGMNRLSGPIPPRLRSLSALTTLNLRGDQINGAIPSSLGDLTRLTELNLWGNELRGRIPSALGDLTRLAKLDIGRNGRLRGPIPPELLGLTALQVLDISGNKLGGSLPSGLGELTALRELRLFSNHFTGPIPAELGRLTALEKLRLASNKLTGTITSALGELKALEKLDLHDNHLTGPIPDLRQTALNNAAFYDNRFDGNKVDAQRRLPKTCTVLWKNSSG